MSQKRKLLAAELRLQKDFALLDDYRGIKVVFPKSDDLLHFNIRIKPTRGIWKDHNFDLKFDVPEEFPIAPPHVTLLTKIWHPNIDEEGNICLNIIKGDYNPTITILQIIQGIELIFVTPNPYSPLNNAAAEMLIHDESGFREKVEEYMEEFCPCD
ncbi:Ubiquitin-conjugating enzyme family protein [Trichomonas vaginalis G3]|uniref:E2 NEDD8-conjugating enzyme n=1 Tax=Trichomonas vaginalis (strain ATCC PRA-98 / G3) TaxID=412133 RepID=A2E403_TRIV3|nr:NEDD8 transferase protein [Trichomonas vaginalis G3]EAY12658.1 Ubiquitin-conjugating enzyme family protein [Trichomonas vaginalis G3]KAI5547021.1 NEDD8 transferase protein [Trichomonas vaginalis G3]|eukprot:XP_001324881.1 Ubiquitin-conjugating enzyme family protein [Trichomonas vaginalis G3]